VYGYAGKVLCLDLDNLVSEEEELDEDFAHKYLGGRGFNSKVLSDNVGKEVSPFSRENLLIFGVGPLNGTLSPSSGRFTVTCKSPLTGILGDANCGGSFGAVMKWSGYDQIIVKGVAEEPIYLLIDNGKVQIKSAKKLWGKNVSEVEDYLKRLYIGSQVVSIGKAGERLVRFACIMTNYTRAAGRTGVGAVMGSKKLKAVVIKGKSSNAPKLYDEVNFKKLCKDLVRRIKEQPIYGDFSKYGTTLLTMYANESGALPIRNNQKGRDERAVELYPDNFFKKYYIRTKPCFNCPTGCGKWIGLNGKFMALPEFESFVALGTNCELFDLGEICAINRLCNEYGMDTISCGHVISFAMECKGKFKFKSFPSFGKSFLRLIRSIGERTSRLGFSLGEGVERFSSFLDTDFATNSKDFKLTVKGLEVPAWDCRKAQAFGLGWATSTRGADHLRSLPSFEVLGYSKDKALKIFGTEEVVNPNSVKGKAALVRFHENFFATVDSAEICKYNVFSHTEAIMPEDLAKLLRLSTGYDITAQVLLEGIGERIIQLERKFNLNMGKEEDTLPKRFLTEPLDGNVVRLEPMLSEYRRLRNW